MKVVDNSIKIEKHLVEKIADKESKEETFCLPFSQISDHYGISVWLQVNEKYESNE